MSDFRGVLAATTVYGAIALASGLTGCQSEPAPGTQNQPLPVGMTPGAMPPAVAGGPVVVPPTGAPGAPPAMSSTPTQPMAPTAPAPPTTPTTPMPVQPMAGGGAPPVGPDPMGMNPIVPNMMPSMMPDPMEMSPSMMMPQPMMREDLGEGTGQDVITIGDSWMNYILVLNGIEIALERVSGRNYRNYGFAGTVMDQIIDQYRSAKRADPDIKTVVMTGGGNDILIGDSLCSGEQCKRTVDTVTQKQLALRAEMEADGVQDVVLIGYAYPSDMTKHWSLDYSYDISIEMCKPTSVPRCHFIQTRDQISSMLADGIHPNAAGYELIGKWVWEKMQAEGMRR